MYHPNEGIKICSFCIGRQFHRMIFDGTAILSVPTDILSVGGLKKFFPPSGGMWVATRSVFGGFRKHLYLCTRKTPKIVQL